MVAKSIGACLVSCLLSSCAMIPQPFPIFKYGPDAKPISDRQEISAVEQVLSRSSSPSTRSRTLAMRNQTVVVQEKEGFPAALKALPVPDIKPGVTVDYVLPPSFSLPAEGKSHYYNFTMSKDFAVGLNAFLSGNLESAAQSFETILTDSHLQDEVGWQASMHLAYLHLMTGRPDLAESEVRRTELWERKMTSGNNVYTRAIRAEVRYWAGDFDGASRDAADVINSIGNWKGAIFSLNPPRDQADIVRFSSAKIRAMTVVGMLYTARGMYREAIPWLEEAAQEMNDLVLIHKIPLYSLYINTNNWEVFYGQGWCFTSLATALLAIEPESQRAAEIFALAEKYFDAIGYAAGKVLIESFKAQVMLATGRYLQAEKQAEIALEHAKNRRLLDFIWRMEAVRGEALVKMNRWEEAESALRGAQTVIDLLSGTMVSDMAKVRFGVGKEIITTNLMQVDIRKNDQPALFSDLERGRARAFVAMLANRSVAVGGQNRIVARIRELDKEILNERQKKYGFLKTESTQSNREDDLLVERQKLVGALFEQDPILAEAFAVSAVDLTAVQKSLSPRDLMIYALPVNDNDPLQLLMITRTETRLRRLPTTAAEFGRHLRTFVDTLWQSAAARQREALSRLSRDLAVDTWSKDETNVNVLFVPSGDLHFVPWGALDARFAVTVLPTGGWGTRVSGRLETKLRAVIVGDPAFGNQLSQLPGARDEALALARQYGTHALIGTEATEMALRGNVGTGVDILHLATHALYDPVYPLQSSLILSDGQKAFPLTAERLFEQPLHSSLVVLSACETGMGQVTSGDDLLGLTRSFYLGGAKSVLSSLWTVSDSATRIFMETFHRIARSGDYGQAWLSARDALKSSGYEPEEYGAFILGGAHGR